MPGYSRADLERDILLLDKARAAIAGMVARYGQCIELERVMAEAYNAGVLTLAQAHWAYVVMDRLAQERICTGYQAQPVYEMIDALENGYVCGVCGILQGHGVERAHRGMGHPVLSGCRLRFKAAMLGAMNGDKKGSTIHVDGDALETLRREILRKEMLRVEAQTLAERSQARVVPEPQAPMPKESQRWKKEQEIEDPEWRHNLDATKDIGYPAREEGRYGSHPAHDDFDDEAKP